MNFDGDNYITFKKAAANLEKSEGAAQELQEFLGALGKIEDLNALNEKGNSLMHIAAFRGQELVIRELVNAGADINARNEQNGGRPLHFAIYNNSFGCVNALVEMEADVNAQDMEGHNALHIAAAYNVPQVAEIILAAGADATAKNIYGEVPADMTESPEIKKSLNDALAVQTNIKIMSEVKACQDTEPVRIRRKM